MPFDRFGLFRKKGPEPEPTEPREFCDDCGAPIVNGVCLIGCGWNRKVSSGDAEIRPAAPIPASAPPIRCPEAVIMTTTPPPEPEPKPEEPSMGSPYVPPACPPPPRPAEPDPAASTQVRVEALIKQFHGLDHEDGYITDAFEASVIFGELAGIARSLAKVEGILADQARLLRAEVAQLKDELKSITSEALNR